MERQDIMIGDWVRNEFGDAEQVQEIGSGLVMLAYNDLYQYETSSQYRLQVKYWKRTLKRRVHVTASLMTTLILKSANIMTECLS